MSGSSNCCPSRKHICRCISIIIGIECCLRNEQGHMHLANQRLVVLPFLSPPGRSSRHRCPRPVEAAAVPQQLRLHVQLRRARPRRLDAVLHLALQRVKAHRWAKEMTLTDRPLRCCLRDEQTLFNELVVQHFRTQVQFDCQPQCSNNRLCDAKPR